MGGIRDVFVQVIPASDASCDPGEPGHWGDSEEPGDQGVRSAGDYPLLAEGGKLAAAIADFEPRTQQQQMARAVERAIKGAYPLLCEAGTGTGKTLAYLVPALQAGVRVIISTGTRNLQDQLFDKDLPLVRRALGQPVKVVLLKGRANYLCLNRLDQAEAQGTLDATLNKGLQQIRRWSALTQHGDLAELTTLGDDDPVRPFVTSTVDNCLGQDCSDYHRCHVMKARRAALDADIVVINHHLYFADMALREDGFGELLPAARAVIFDEAHQLPEIATRFFGWTLSTGQMRELADDSERAVRAAAGDLRSAQRAAGTLRQVASELRSHLPQREGQVPWEDVREDGEVAGLIQRMREALDGLAAVVDVDDGGGELSSCLRRATAMSRRAASLLLEPDDAEVRWIETHRRGFTWRVAPLEIAKVFGDHLASHNLAWVFTSATLAVDGSFTHFAERMGIGDKREEHVWESPFDYMRQAVCYLPENLPEPRGAAHTESLLQTVMPLCEAAKGRTFLLFTSHRAMQFAANWLSSRTRYPLLVQGQAPKAELVRQFVEKGNALLLGTASFWEGVDVRGDALSCVVIDKLPFAAPDDPVLEARVKSMREQGREPFRHYQLPLAVIALKQGAGRLIRSQKDCGVLVLGDPRLVTKGYGRVFLRSLPTMPITQDGEEAATFLRERTSQNGMAGIADGPADEERAGSL